MAIRWQTIHQPLLLLALVGVIASQQVTVTGAGAVVTATEPTTTTAAPKAICPDGKGISVTKCHDKTPKCTDAKQQCYKHPIDTNAEQSMCCNSQFCPDTKMASYVSLDTNGYYHVYSKDLPDNRPVWYSWHDANGPKNCPIPITAAFHLERTGTGDSAPIDVNSTIHINERLPWYKETKKQWTTEDKKTPLTSCSKNAECDFLKDVDMKTTDKYVPYCYRSRNPSLDPNKIYNQSESIDPEAKFCYMLKQLDPLSEFYMKPDDVGPKFCNVHADCKDPYHPGVNFDPWYCHKTRTYYNAANNSRSVGICLKTKKCKTTNGTMEYAVRTAEGKVCLPAQAESCAKTGIQLANWDTQQYSPNCTAISVADQQAEDLCCYEPVESCALGRTQTPPAKCSTVNDCNKPYDIEVFDNHNKWCDEKINLCCVPSGDNSLVYCPDKATLLQFEPKCEGYQPGQNTSGTCLRPLGDQTGKNVTVGMCVFGHCCPQTTVSADNKVQLGQHTYITNVPCKDNKINGRFNVAYCDMNLKRVVVIGKKTLRGEDQTKMGKKCNEHTDCGSSEVCIKEDQEKACYGDPSKIMQKTANDTYFLMTIISICLMIPCGIATIVFYAMWRSRTVCDKLKKKKGKGKGGKNSGGSKGKKSDDDGESKKSKKSKSKSKKEETGGETDDKDKESGKSSASAVQ